MLLFPSEANGGVIFAIYRKAWKLCLNPLYSYYTEIEILAGRIILLDTVCRREKYNPVE
jgi:hypothetical protein